MSGGLVAGRDDEPAALLHPVPAGVDQVGEHLGRGQPLAVVLLERSEAGPVDVQPRHVGDGERAEERQPVAERGAHHDVDVLGGGHPLLDEVDGLLEQDVLQSVEHEPGLVVDPGGEFAGPRHHGLDGLHDGLVGARVRDQLDAGDERGGVGEVNAEEALGVGQVCREVADRQGGGVAADDRVRAGGCLDALQYRTLDLRLLQHGFLDQIRLGDRLRQAVGGAQVGPDQIGRPGIEEPLGLEVLGFATQPLEVATGQGGVGVDDDHVEAGHREDLGDAPTHVAGADDGDVLELSRHDGHDLPWLGARRRAPGANVGQGPRAELGPVFGLPTDVIQHTHVPWM